MNAKFFQARIIFAVLAVGAAVIPNSSTAKDRFQFSREVKMNAPSRIAAVLEKTKPVCFTRFVIDVPSSATIVYGRMTADTEIDRYPEMAGSIDDIISRHIELNREEARIFDNRSELDKLAGIPIKTPNGNLKHVIGIKGGGEYSVYSFLKLGADAYVLRSSGVLSETVKEIMRRNESIASALRARHENEIPPEDGVCIDGAFTSQNPTFENIEFGFRLEEFPDVHFSLSLIRQGDGPEPQEEFFRRHEEALQDRREAGYNDFVNKIKFLRKAPRILNGWSGDELLIKFPQWKEIHEIQQFTFWSAGKANDALHPQVDIVLDTGVRNNKTNSVKSSLTDEEALELWERLLNSIRVRPIKKL